MHASTFYVQAVRDNGRIALSDKAYAEHLWQALGLQPALAGIMVEGAQACGLNPNIRIYRHASIVCNCKAERWHSCPYTSICPWHRANAQHSSRLF